MNIKQLREQIEIQQKLADDVIKRNSHKDMYSNPHAREIERLQSLVTVAESGLEFDSKDYSSTGTVTLKNSKGEVIIYALRTGKWRYKNFPTVWYPSKSFDQFVEKFVRS